jgi:hypothetical protein
MCLAVLDTPCRAQSPVPVFTIVDPDITLPPGASEGRGSMLLRADKLTAENASKPPEVVQDLNVPHPPRVDVTFELHPLDQTETSRRWVLTADFKNLPNNVTQKRYVEFQFDGQQVTLQYTLTNKNTASFAWSVKGPPGEMKLPQGEPVEIGIAVQGVSATKVRLLQATLLEQSRKQPVDGGWMLCREELSATNKKCVDTDLTLAAHSSQRLWLYANPDAELVGKYVGNVTIGAAEKPEGDTFSLTVYGTSARRQIMGVIAILLGVACAWICTVYLQNRLNRAQLLLPATALRERVLGLQSALANPPPAVNPADMATTQNLLKTLAASLTEGQLDAQNYLPARVPNPFRSMAPNTDAFKLYINTASAQVALLDLLVKDGFQAVWARIPPAPSDAQRTAISNASQAIDALAGTLPIPATNTVVSTLHNTLATLTTSLAPPGSALAAPQPGLAAPQPRSFEQIGAEIRLLSGASWLIFGTLATVLGTYVLVLSNLGFGVSTDYLICLLWGFGLPIGGTQLVQATVGSASTALGFSVPK